MALSKLDFRPGVNREATTYANEGTYYACDKIRFRSGRPEKLGGWINQSYTNTYYGMANSLANWVPSTGANLLAVGTTLKYYVESGGVYHDITPVRATSTINNNPFATTNGSHVVTVTDTSHGAYTDDFVTFSGATAVGGLTLNGEYQILQVVDANTYKIYSATAATSTSAGGGGASVVATYYVNGGTSVYTLTPGSWGVGAWSSGTWGGTSSSASFGARPFTYWSQDNFENDLIFAPRDSDIYYWTLDTSTWARAVTLESKANSTTKTSTTATSGGAGTTITVTDPTGIDVGAVVSGTNVTAGTYVTAVSGTTVTLSATTSGAASGTYTFSYAGRFVPNKTFFLMASDTSHFTMAFGANPYDPTNFDSTFDPMLVRWSDQENPFEWVPAVTNQSGEQHLSNGSYLVTAVDTRQEILVWSDSALYTMQYVGPPYVWSFALLNSNISIASQNAAITVNNITYWMGVDKFYIYNGRVETLPCALRQFIFSNINRDLLSRVISGTNEGYNEIWWYYPSASSTVNDTYVIYNYLDNVWYYGYLNRSAWLDSPLREYPMAAFSVQNTYVDATVNSSVTSIAIYNAEYYPSAGTVTIGTEDITYTGIQSNTLTGCVRGANNTTAASHAQYDPVTFKTPNQVLFHEYGNDDASQTVPVPIEAYVESADFDIGDGHNFGYIWRILPDLTFVGSTGDSPKVYMTVKARQNSGSTYTSDGNPSVTRTATVPVEQYTGQVYVRIRGRQMLFRIESEDLGVAWQLGTPRIDIRPDGRR